MKKIDYYHMPKVMSKVSTTKSTTSGIMFNVDKNYTLNNLSGWVSENCKDAYKIGKNNKDEIVAIYEDRIETYWIKP